MNPTNTSGVMLWQACRCGIKKASRSSAFQFSKEKTRNPFGATISI
jgi:hypothetical protein